MKRLLGRKRIPLDYLHEVEEWLLAADWALVFAGSTYAMIKVTAIEGWVRLSASRVETELAKISRGEFDFKKLQHLLARQASDKDTQDDDSTKDE